MSNLYFEQSLNAYSYTLAGPVLAVRPSTHNDHDGDVFAATSKATVDIGSEAGYPAPEQRLRILQAS